MGCETTVETVATKPQLVLRNLRSGDTLVVNLQSIPYPVHIQTQIDDHGEISLRYIDRLAAAGITVSQ